MRSELAILLLLASAAHADKAAEPRVQGSELTLLKIGDSSKKLVVTRAQIKETRSTEPCTVHITFETKHGEFRSFELDFAFRHDGGRPTPVAVKATTAKHGGAAGKGNIAVRPSTSPAGYATRFGAQITAAGVKWQLTGTFALANVSCVQWVDDPG